MYTLYQTTHIYKDQKITRDTHSQLVLCIICKNYSLKSSTIRFYLFMKIKKNIASQFDFDTHTHTHLSLFNFLF